MKIKIDEVKKESIADELEIVAGDYLSKVNDEEIVDVLDYKYHMSDEEVTIEIEKANGEVEIIEIEKDMNEDIGLVFENELMSPARKCANNCIFCFMEQLPEDVRSTLIYKDDDYRLSFLTGNYVTMTNMSEKDIDRIIKYHLSPINISIHATDIEVREMMLNNKRADKVFGFMEKLNKAGIFMNGQIVLCKDINDGKILEKTLVDLEKYFDHLFSVSIVPVGLSKFRKGLYELKPFEKEDAKKVVDLVSKFQEKYREKYDSTKVYLSDEWYVKAEVNHPAYDTYDGFPQLENGVGMLANFEEEFEEYIAEVKESKKLMSSVVTDPKTVTVLTGQIAKGHMLKQAARINEEFPNIKVNILPIENKYMGERITVTGLIVGEDIIEQVNEKAKEGYNFGEYILISDVMLKDDEDIFLDDLSVDDVRKQINQPLIIAYGNAKSFIQTIINKQ
ncbi:MAG: DUF512 domain-containing protein [Clostridia bacterium]